jgi:hypothetical protein
MPIEITAEMLDAYLGAKTSPAGLAAVLAIVERDYVVMRRECEEEPAGDPDTRCIEPGGHVGPHRAWRSREVTW